MDTTINLATASEVRWFKATLPGVSAGGAGYVDMWTTPTANPVPALDMTDTGVSMYAAATGALVTYDDDDGPGLHAQMSYGSTTSRGTTTFGTLTAGVALDGRDGALAGGDYYIAVSRYLMTAPAVGYNVTSSSTSTQRNTVLHIRTQPNSQPTNPVLSGPAATLDAGQITFTINVTGGQNPDSTDLAVTIDLQSFGGAQGTTMTGPGGTPGTYTITFAAPAGASDFTAFPFTVHASDSQGRSAADVTLNFVGLGTVGWDETANGAADSGDMMASAQVPTGNGALNVITGAWTAGDNADVYKIQICDFANFIASTQYSPGGPDTQLFLFNEQGMGVSSNDDNPSGAQGLTSALDATGLTADGIYYLAVSRYDLDPVDASAAAIFLDTPFNTVHTPDGPGAANPWDHFDAGGTAGNYRLSLQGVCYAPSTPTQCSPADVGVQGGAFGHDRRLDNNDFISFITLFFAQDPAADVGIQGGTGGSDNAWDNNDFIAFISYFFNDSANCNG